MLWVQVISEMINSDYPGVDLGRWGREMARC